MCVCSTSANCMTDLNEKYISMNNSVYVKIIFKTMKKAQESILFIQLDLFTGQ